MSDYCHIHWTRENVKVKRVATESRAKDTLVKIELLVADPWELSMLIQSLEEAKRPPKVEEKQTQRRPAEPELLALPAPVLRLSYRGEE